MYKIEESFEIRNPDLHKPNSSAKQPNPKKSTKDKIIINVAGTTFHNTKKHNTQSLNQQPKNSSGMSSQNPPANSTSISAGLTITSDKKSSPECNRIRKSIIFQEWPFSPEKTI